MCLSSCVSNKNLKWQITLIIRKGTSIWLQKKVATK